MRGRGWGNDEGGINNEELDEIGLVGGLMEEGGGKI
jgi:hypothetical protein